jgi:hypothetical protein
MKRSGVADLPLHGGRVPQWLADRMTKLGIGITEAVVHHQGTNFWLCRTVEPLCETYPMRVFCKSQN